MNERIKQLVNQAGAIPIHGKPKDRALVGYDNIEKFAELIVKECLKLCDEVKDDLELVPNEVERKATELGVTFCYDAIKGEFGVEE